VAWDVPGLRDSIINNETGFLAPFPDEQAFAKEVMKLLNDDDTWNRLSQTRGNGRLRFLGQWQLRGSMQ